MTAGLDVASASVPELALRLIAIRGTAAYAAYLVAAGAAADAIDELCEELVAFDPALAIEVLRPPGGEQLFVGLSKVTSEVVLIDAASYRDADWRLLDRRRSSLSRPGLMVFVTTPDSFGDLMQAAPNLSSWLGGFVFERPRDETWAEPARAQRLAALRSWAHKSDTDVIEAATRGQLPADPEYAEWLVLLGRGDLLDNE
ncbi:MAG TPA: hypothetical protein VHN14_05270 [Kofleriaceae bacterium]|jgi:hypothetical protein|nr:hypothetical protein [Kofleriaceae bacterium]